MSATERVLKLFQNYLRETEHIRRYLRAAISLWNNFEIISSKFPHAEIKLSQTNIEEGWNNSISHVTMALLKKIPKTPQSGYKQAFSNQLSVTANVVKRFCAAVVKQFRAAVVKQFCAAVVKQFCAAVVKQFCAAVVKQFCAAVVETVLCCCCETVSCCCCETVLCCCCETVLCCCCETVSCCWWSCWLFLVVVNIIITLVVLDDVIVADVVCHPGPRCKIQDRSPKSRPVASLNQSQTQLTRPVASSLGMQRAPGHQNSCSSSNRCIHSCLVVNLLS